MPKKFYSDMSNHCLRFYIRYPKPTFKSEIERLGWEACQKVLNTYSKWEQDIISYIYRSGSISENVASISYLEGVTVHHVWKLVDKVQKDVAIERGYLKY